MVHDATDKKANAHSANLHPLPWRAQHLHDLVFLAASSRYVVVTPCNQWGSGDHDGLKATTIQAKLDTAIIEEVELQVAPSTQKLHTADERDRGQEGCLQDARY